MRRLLVSVIAGSLGACLLASPAVADTLDQSDLVPDSQQSSAVLNGQLTAAQTVTVGVGGALSRVDVHLSVGLGPLDSDPLLEVRDATILGGPGSQVLATAVIPRASVVGSLARANIASGLAVEAGQVIALVVRYLPTSASSVLWLGAGADYAGGASWYSNDGGSTWSTAGNPFPDQVFATYVRLRGADGPGMAPVLQQVEAIGGSCSPVAADDAALGYGSGVRGGWSVSWAQWADAGRGGAVCTRTLRFEGSAWTTG